MKEGSRYDADADSMQAQRIDEFVDEMQWEETLGCLVYHPGQRWGQSGSYASGSQGWQSQPQQVPTHPAMVP